MGLKEMFLGPALDLVQEFALDNIPKWKAEYVAWLIAKVKETPNEYDDRLVPLTKAILGVE